MGTRFVVGDQIVEVPDDEVEATLTDPSRADWRIANGQRVNGWRYDSVTSRYVPASVPSENLGAALQEDEGSRRMFLLSSPQSDFDISGANHRLDFQDNSSAIETAGHAGADALLAPLGLISQAITGQDNLSMAAMRRMANEPGSPLEGLIFTNEQNALAQAAHPIASAAGTVAGSLPYLALGAGGAAATGARAAAVRIAGGGLPGRMLGTVAGLGAEGAVEGAMIEALAHEGRRLTLGQPFSGEALAASVGAGALWGGVGGAALGTIGAAAQLAGAGGRAILGRVASRAPAPMPHGPVAPFRTGRAAQTIARNADDALRNSPLNPAMRVDNSVSSLGASPRITSAVPDGISPSGIDHPQMASTGLAEHIENNVGRLVVEGMEDPVRNSLERVADMDGWSGVRGYADLPNELRGALFTHGTGETSRIVSTAAKLRDTIQETLTRNPNPVLRAAMSELDSGFRAGAPKSIGRDFLDAATDNMVRRSQGTASAAGEFADATTPTVIPGTPAVGPRGTAPMAEQLGRAEQIAGDIVGAAPRTAGFAAGIAAEKLASKVVPGGGLFSRVVSRGTRFAVQSKASRVAAKKIAEHGISQRASKAVTNLARRAEEALDGFNTSLTDGFVAHLRHRHPGIWTAALRDPSMREEAYREITGYIGELTSDPQGTMDILEERAELGNLAYEGLGADVSRVMMSQIGYLSQHVPEQHIASNIPGQSFIPPSMMEVDDFMRRVQALEDPYSVIDLLSSGMLTDVDLDAVQSVYPEIYSDIVTSVAEVYGNHAAEAPVAYQMRLQMSAILGRQTDPTLNAEMVLLLQRQSAQTQQQAKALGPGMNGSTSLRTDLGMDPNSLTTPASRMAGGN